jgi:hypothetical protein
VAEGRLYREAGEGVEYWESWVNDDGTAVVHYGRLGERGQVEEFSDPDAFADYLGPRVRELHAEGFRNVPEDEHATVMLQWPRSAVPDDVDGTEELWDRVEELVNEELGWTGLGRCTGIDLSSELTAMAEAVDARLAVKVLASALVQSGLPPADR